MRKALLRIIRKISFFFFLKLFFGHFYGQSFIKILLGPFRRCTSGAPQMKILNTVIPKINTGLQMKVQNQKWILLFRNETYVVSTQKNRLNETVLLSTKKHMC